MQYRATDATQAEEGRIIFEKQISAIEHHWDDVCTEAELGEVDRRLLWGRQFLNPYSVAAN